MSDFVLQIAQSYGRVLSNPAFTPMLLSGVIDLTGYYAMLDPPNPKSVNTNVPSTKKCVVFFRGTHEIESGATRNNYALYNLAVVNGYWHIVFESRPNPIRLYIFSDTLAPIPDWGIYFYRNGEIVYHQNCLPLAMKTYDKNDSGKKPRGMKLATLPAVVETEFYDPETWGHPVISMRQWFSGAGLLYYGEIGERYKWGVNVISGDIIPVSEGFQPQLRPNAMTTISYIETDVYDQYYKQSLGY